MEPALPRIPFPEPETMTPDQRRVHDSIISGPRGRIVGPLRAALHNPELADHWQKLGALLRYGTSLEARHSELAILVTARACNSSFEWFQHEQPALESGLSAAIIESIRTRQTPEFQDGPDRIIHDYALQLLQNHTVEETTHQAVCGLYGAKGVVELTALIGYYTLVAMTLNAHGFELPEGATDPFGDAP
ncbi:MAG: carboxymuconolactone decarboxylase family protein [Blastomonas sp.]